MVNTQSRRIALCGVLAALGVVLLAAGSALGIGTYAGPMLASLLTLPALLDYGPATALTQYAATALLGLLLVPETELTLFYALVVGPYPIVAAFCGRLRWAPLRWGAKFGWFNAALAAVYALLLVVLMPGLAAELTADGAPALLVLAGLLNLAFFLYDRALASLAKAWRIRKRRKPRASRQPTRKR